MNRLLATTTVVGLAILAGACDNRQNQPADTGTPATETTPTPAPEATPPAAPAPSAATAGAASITVQQKPELGNYLADADGRALYLFEADTKPGESACYDACAQAWPPFIATQGTPTVQGADIDASKLGTLQRRDGSTQVTYAGHPLYYFANDTGPQSTAGQDIEGFGAEWYLVAPDGNKVEEKSGS